MSSIMIVSVAKAQQPSITPNDMDLPNYQFPYPAQFIDLHIKGDDLKMAYIDVKPLNSNGHSDVIAWKKF